MLRAIGYYKTMEQIRDAFVKFCHKENIEQCEENFQAWLNGLRIMKFTLL